MVEAEESKDACSEIHDLDHNDKPNLNATHRPFRLSVDLDRMVWDFEYRDEIRRRLQRMCEERAG